MMTMISAPLFPRKGAVMSDIIAGRNAVREALRGTRPIQKSWSLKAAMGEASKKSFPSVSSAMWRWNASIRSAWTA